MRLHDEIQQQIVFQGRSVAADARRVLDHANSLNNRFAERLSVDCLIAIAGLLLATERLNKACDNPVLHDVLTHTRNVRARLGDLFHTLKEELN